MKKNSSFETPILFLIFNRPGTERKVFEQIRKIKPKYLYVAADGPRKNKEGEGEKCLEARRIVDEGIDWPCEVKKLYRKNNLGCKLAVSGAIDWFFDSVEEGIILEDDCMPDLSFFKYCQNLLERYRNDDKVMHISGDSFFDRLDEKNSYYFSRSPLIWGWATWKRAWCFYNVVLDMQSKKYFNKILSNRCLSIIDRIYWYLIFKNVTNNNINTWDYQWVYTLWKNNGLSIIPNVNLIKNIGFTNDATHTKNASSVLSEVKINKMIFPLKHPKIQIDKKRDIELANKAFNINIFSVLYLILMYIVNIFKK